MEIALYSERDCRDQLNLVLSFFPRVETKLTAVLAINTALLGALSAAVATQTMNGYWRWIAPSATLASLAASYLCLYKGSFPDTRGGHSSLVYFKDIANRNESLFVSEYMQQSEDARIKDVLAQTWRNAEILSKKFHQLRLAYTFTAVALVPWVISLISSDFRAGR